MRAAAGVAMAAGAAFAALAGLVAVDWAPLLDADVAAVEAVTDHTRAHPRYRDAWRAISVATHAEWMLVAALLVAGGLAVARRFGAATWLAVVAGLGALVGPALKRLVGRERPALDRPLDAYTGFGFPAGHATSPAMLAAALLVLAWPALSARIRAAAVVVAVVVPALAAWSRFALGGHYPSDLVAGFAVGVAWVAAWRPALPALCRRLPPG